MREFCSYVRHLPSDCRLHSVLRRDMEARGVTPTPIEDLPSDVWDTKDHLLATIADKLEVLYWIQLDHKSSSSPAYPAYVPRPGIRRKRRGASAWFSGMGLE